MIRPKVTHPKNKRNTLFVFRHKNRAAAPADHSSTFATALFRAHGIYDHSPQTFPSLSVNFPVHTLIRSINQPIPRQPPVSSQIIPVPIFPVINLCTPNPPRNNVINIAPVLLIFITIPLSQPADVQVFHI